MGGNKEFDILKKKILGLATSTENTAHTNHLPRPCGKKRGEPIIGLGELIALGLKYFRSSANKILNAQTQGHKTAVSVL